MNDFHDKKVIIIVAIILALLLIAGFFGIRKNLSDDSKVYASKENEVCELTTTEEIPHEFYVDIKGAVKKPGVYKVSEKNIVKDVIDMAGGLKSTAVTSNINLSKKVTSEMVIYVYTKSELKTDKTTKIISDEKILITTEPMKDESNSDQNTRKLININVASKTELMTIPNIGESKADSIIIYRTENKFNKIEDIMNVSGIGESVFAKIKEFITV